VDASAVRAAVEPAISPKIRLPDDAYERVARAFRAGPKAEPFFHGPANDLLAEALSPYYYVRWNAGTHTNHPVPLLARGPSAGAFAGWLQAWEATDRLCRLLGI
jgi:alkaline phosphatase